MKIHTTIIVHYPIEQVWFKLTEFEKYPEWNPFITKIIGSQVVGERLFVDILLPQGKKTTFKPTLVNIQPMQEMRWVGILGTSWLFRGEHYFQVEKIDENSTRLIQGEVFSGCLVPLFRQLAGKKTLAGFHLMNQHLDESLSRDKK